MPEPCSGWKRFWYPNDCRAIDEQNAREAAEAAARAQRIAEAQRNVEQYYKNAENSADDTNRYRLRAEAAERASNIVNADKAARMAASTSEDTYNAGINAVRASLTIMDTGEFAALDKRAREIQPIYFRAKADADAAAAAVKRLQDAEAARKAAAAAAAKAAAEAAARKKAKEDAKAAWDAAQATANAALAVWQKQQALYTDAANAVPSFKIVYDNAQAALDAAKAKKVAYEDALKQQTAAVALLKTATDALSKAGGNARENLEKTFKDDSAFVKSAASFPNANGADTKAPNVTFGIEKEYNTMTAAWTAYNSAKTALSAVDAKKLEEITTATSKLVDAYNKFNASKNAYASAVIAAVTSSTANTNYIKDNQENANVFGLTNEYKKMTDAWATVTGVLKKSDAAGVIVNYVAYVPTKLAFNTALLLAQDKKAEADFQESLAAGRDAAAKWAKSGAKGCRNIQTAASTDANMLDQDIACQEDEYISGYTKVSGFASAPVDPKVSRDNIKQYLAVKYSCCTAPSGEKGPRGKQGLPGFEAKAGPDGPKGPRGVDGPEGPKGEKGDAGPEGERGAKGESGDDGDDGCVGEPGRPGKSLKVPLIKHVAGPTGPTGNMGPRGVQGPKGKDGVIKQEPNKSFTELDKTVALFNIENKINAYRKGY